MFTIDMDAIRDNHLVLPRDSSLEILAMGHPLTVPGKIYNATRLDGVGGQYLDVMERRDVTCLTSLVSEKCFETPSKNDM